MKAASAWLLSLENPFEWSNREIASVDGRILAVRRLDFWLRFLSDRDGWRRIEEGIIAKKVRKKGFFFAKPDSLPFPLPFASYRSKSTMPSSDHRPTTFVHSILVIFEPWREVRPWHDLSELSQVIAICSDTCVMYCRLQFLSLFALHVEGVWSKCAFKYRELHQRNASLGLGSPSFGSTQTHRVSASVMFFRFIHLESCSASDSIKRPRCRLFR